MDKIIIYKNALGKQLLIIPGVLLIILFVKGLFGDESIFNELTLIIATSVLFFGLLYLAVKSVKNVLTDDKLVIKECFWKREILYETVKRVDIVNKLQFSIEAPSAPQIVLYDKEDEEIIRLSPIEIRSFEKELNDRIKSRG